MPRRCNGIWHAWRCATENDPGSSGDFWLSALRRSPANAVASISNRRINQQRNRLWDIGCEFFRFRHQWALSIEQSPSVMPALHGMAALATSAASSARIASTMALARRHYSIARCANGHRARLSSAHHMAWLCPTVNADGLEKQPFFKLVPGDHRPHQPRNRRENRRPRGSGAGFQTQGR